MLLAPGTRHVFSVLAIAAMLATAGCLSEPVGETTFEPSETTDDELESAKTGDERSSQGSSGERSDIDVRRVADANAPDLAAELPEPVECGDGAWVGYWGTGSTDQTWREPGELRTGWQAPANQSALFVAFRNTTAVGADHVDYDLPVHADGAAIEVERTTGGGLYAVVLMRDVNDNGEYDPGVDRPCAYDGEDPDAGPIEMSDWLWVDWGDDDDR